MTEDKKGEKLKLLQHLDTIFKLILYKFIYYRLSGRWLRLVFVQRKMSPDRKNLNQNQVQTIIAPTTKYL